MERPALVGRLTRMQPLCVRYPHAACRAPPGVKWPFILVSTSTELLLASYKAQSTATLSRDMLQAVPFTGKDIRFIQYDPHSEEVFVLDWGTQMLIALSKLDDWRQVCTVLRL